MATVLGLSIILYVFLMLFIMSLSEYYDKEIKRLESSLKKISNERVESIYSRARLIKELRNQEIVW